MLSIAKEISTSPHDVVHSSHPTPFRMVQPLYTQQHRPHRPVLFRFAGPALCSRVRVLKKPPRIGLDGIVGPLPPPSPLWVAAAAAAKPALEVCAVACGAACSNAL